MTRFPCSSKILICFHHHPCDTGHRRPSAPGHSGALSGRRQTGRPTLFGSARMASLGAVARALGCFMSVVPRVPRALKMTSFDDRAYHSQGFVPRTLCSHFCHLHSSANIHLWALAPTTKGPNLSVRRATRAKKIQRLRSLRPLVCRRRRQLGGNLGEGIVPSLSPFTASAHESPPFLGQRYQHALAAQCEKSSNPTAGPKGGDIAKCSPLRPDAERQPASS
jgi:hypothetical protein